MYNVDSYRESLITLLLSLAFKIAHSHCPKCYKLSPLLVLITDPEGESKETNVSYRKRNYLHQYCHKNHANELLVFLQLNLEYKIIVSKNSEIISTSGLFCI